MEQPGRQYNNSAYRYGMNGQEHEDEVAQGIYTAEFWEYDSRTGRRWNLDPVPQTDVSDYACFSNNPILISDAKGDTPSSEKNKSGAAPEISEDSPLKTPKFQMLIGNNLSTPEQQASNGRTGSHPTLAYSSQVSLYNTNIHSFNTLSEGDHFFQILGRVGKTDWQLGVTGFKEKIDYNTLGHAWEAPTNALFTVARNIPFKKTFFKDNLQFNLNVSGGVGGLYGRARVQGVGELDKHYNRIGESAALIIRFDATIAHHLVLWEAATATGNHTDANKWGWSATNYSTIGLKGGVGLNLESLKRKRP